MEEWIAMKKIWRNVRQKTAELLIGTMVLTCFSPAVGWAGTFREMALVSEDGNVATFQSAKVSADFETKSDSIALELGEYREIQYMFKVEVDATLAPDTATATSARAVRVATEPDGESGTMTKSEVEEQILANLEFDAQVKSSSSVPVTVQTEPVLNEDVLKVGVTIQAPDDAQHAGKTWSGTITLMPKVSDGAPFDSENMTLTGSTMSLNVNLTGETADSYMIPEVDRVALTPGETKEIIVKRGPADSFAVPSTYLASEESADDYFKAECIKSSADSFVLSVTGIQASEEVGYVNLQLFAGEDEAKADVLAEAEIEVYVSEPIAPLPDEEEADVLLDSIIDILNSMEHASEGEKLLAAEAVISSVQKIDTEQLEANEEKLEEVEELLAQLLGVEINGPDEVEGVESIRFTGAILNLRPGQSGTLEVQPVETPQLGGRYTNTRSLDIKLVDQAGNRITNLAVPMKLTFGNVSGLDYSRPIIIRHIRENGSSEELRPVNSNGILSVWVRGYSTFVFANKVNHSSTNQGGNGTSSGGGGGSRLMVSAGSWQQDQTGWKYRYSSGSYAVNGWAELSYNGRTDWYHFNAQGYLDSGWYKENGHTYYLNPVHDGTFGMMATGWKEISGKFYYFNPQTGGPKGAMLFSTTTPDGKTVGADGAWIP